MKQNDSMAIAFSSLQKTLTAKAVIPFIDGLFSSELWISDHQMCSCQSQRERHLWRVKLQETVHQQESKSVEASAAIAIQHSVGHP